jgi:hypothetical protein
MTSGSRRCRPALNHQHASTRDELALEVVGRSPKSGRPAGDPSPGHHDPPRDRRRRAHRPRAPAVRLAADSYDRCFDLSTSAWISTAAALDARRRAAGRVLISPTPVREVAEHRQRHRVGRPLAELVRPAGRVWSAALPGLVDGDRRGGRRARRGARASASAALRDLRSRGVHGTPAPGLRTRPIRARRPSRGVSCRRRTPWRIPRRVRAWSAEIDLHQRDLVEAGSRRSRGRSASRSGERSHSDQRAAGRDRRPGAILTVVNFDNAVLHLCGGQQPRPVVEHRVGSRSSLDRA